MKEKERENYVHKRLCVCCVRENTSHAPLSVY